MTLVTLEKIKSLRFFNFFYRWPLIFKVYHFSLAFLGALTYGFPSRKMIIIGVTGTKGKTTTSNLIAQILTSAGHKVGMATTVNFRIAGKEWINETKQTMLGRFQLQRLLAAMVKAGCRYAVIETSSEGILQYRHRFIDYSVAVFTNLSPEHIERHGSFENYRDAKVQLFKQVAGKKDGIGVYNLDDSNVGYFLGAGIRNKYGYKIHKNFQFSSPAGRQAISPPKANLPLAGNFQFVKIFEIRDIRIGQKGAKFSFNGEEMKMPLLGEFNVYNAAAAISAARSQNIPLAEIKEALKKAKPVPGRMETVDRGQNFTIVVDYAHEPLSLESLYQAVKKIFKPKRTIGVLGAQGGGRDKWKRPAMGKIAAQYCDVIFLTNEDPYDESPTAILDDIEEGFSISNSQLPISKQTTNTKLRNYFKIVDRKEAIKKAIALAQKGDAVVLSGKGGEVWMCVEKGKKIPWNDKNIVERLLEKIPHSP